MSVKADPEMMVQLPDKDDMSLLRLGHVAPMTAHKTYPRDTVAAYPLTALQAMHLLDLSSSKRLPMPWSPRAPWTIRRICSPLHN